ncbi:hypothetical protein llap_3400 [Limosa lapponica baueri]|uniref:Uncharacterized protein n=1 Tax=Limosa lapponica baueri TaxID=1758121 RepID=A0A2I0UJX1_LIMLA|nr:hypothetical protein llap_3400 [Limosa lapponica baueri]
MWNFDVHKVLAVSSSGILQRLGNAPQQGIWLCLAGALLYPQECGDNLPAGTPAPPVPLTEEDGRLDPADFRIHLIFKNSFQPVRDFHVALDNPDGVLG